MFKIVVVLSLLLAVASAWDGYTCRAETVHTEGTVTLSFNQPGLPAHANVDGAEFDVIAFNSFTASTGDVEGSLFSKSFSVGNGFSVGWGLTGPNTWGLWPLVVLQNATFGSGDVLPAGNDIFVGGSAFNAPGYLTSRRVPTSGFPVSFSGTNGFGPLYTQVTSWYTNLAGDLAGQPQTVLWNLQYGTLHITGFSGSLNHGTWILNINVAQFNTINAYSYDTPLSAAGGGLTIVVSGTTGFTASFNGGQLPDQFKYVVYSFNGASTITVNTGVFGSILAPSATVNQVGGVIWGKVVANNIRALQINKAICH
jgi:choice-of-anchor A domain-containing protein